MILDWECPNCQEYNNVGYDCDTCLQRCECCGSECRVQLWVALVELVIKRDEDEGVESE